MAVVPTEITVSLTPPEAQRLAELAEADGVTVEVIAQRLLRDLLEPLADGPERIAAFLDSIPGYHEDFLASLDQIAAGQTVPPSELRQA